jgi:hypothetical protein
MTETLEHISGLLHEAGETHHRVFRIVDGADDDWASWHAQWLIDLSEPPDLLGARPVQSELDRKALYGRGGNCCSAQVLPSGSLKVTNEPHG